MIWSDNARAIGSGLWNHPELVLFILLNDKIVERIELSAISIGTSGFGFFHQLGAHSG
jgi:hypothetical protein